MKLIPRKILFGNPDHIQARISPDNQYISYIAPYNGVLNIWVAPRENIQDAKPVTQDTKRGIFSHSWGYTSEHILYSQDSDGDENWHIYAIDILNNTIKDITAFDGISARIFKSSRNRPEELLVGINHRDPHHHDAYLVNIKTGESEMVLQNDQGFSSMIGDKNLEVRFASKMTSDGGCEWFAHNGSKWDLCLTIGMEDTINTSLLGFDHTEENLYMVESRNRNTSALALYNIASGNISIIGEDKRCDISDTLMHPTKKTVQAYAATYTRKSWTVIDHTIESDFAFLKEIDNGDIEIVDRSDDDNFWITAYLSDIGPVKYYLYDRNTKSIEFLFVSRKDLDGWDLCTMEPVVIKSRDGLNMVSYLTKPKDKKGPYPMVLYVHGGPTARDEWGYNAVHQWLANRGYAVLSVNYRGSTGLGKDFVVAGYGQWAGKAHNDLIDAVDWAVKNGIAIQEKVAIMGGSYGGYATLVGLTFTPDIFACGVDIVGPSNLQTLLESIPPYWKPALDMLKVRIGGDHETPEGREFLKSQSPLTYCDRIKRPLLIGQGAKDPRVKQAESDQIVEALQTKGIPVTYALYPDEGHGFARPENRMAFYAVTESFLANCLGGQLEAVNDDELSQSSIQLQQL